MSRRQSLALSASHNPYGLRYYSDLFILGLSRSLATSGPTLEGPLLCVLWNNGSSSSAPTSGSR